MASGRQEMEIVDVSVHKTERGSHRPRAGGQEQWPRRVKKHSAPRGLKRSPRSRPTSGPTSSAGRLAAVPLGDGSVRSGGERALPRARRQIAWQKSEGLRMCFNKGARQEVELPK